MAARTAIWDAESAASAAAWDAARAAAWDAESAAASASTRTAVWDAAYDAKMREFAVLLADMTEAEAAQ